VCAFLSCSLASTPPSSPCRESLEWLGPCCSEILLRSRGDSAQTEQTEQSPPCDEEQAPISCVHAPALLSPEPAPDSGVRFRNFGMSFTTAASHGSSHRAALQPLAAGPLWPGVMSSDLNVMVLRL